MLSVDFPGVAQLRLQSEVVRASTSTTLGVVNLLVDESVPQADVISVTPVDLHRVDEATGKIYTIMLFAYHGRVQPSPEAFDVLVMQPGHEQHVVQARGSPLVQSFCFIAR